MLEIFHCIALFKAEMPMSAFVFRFQFDPEESDEENMLLIWNFEVDKVLSQTANSQPPKVPEETLPVAPLLDLEKLSAKCNCVSFPETNGIFFGQACDEESQDEGKVCLLWKMGKYS